MSAVGLDSRGPGQLLGTLSGSECQRLKLGSELNKKRKQLDRNSPVYISGLEILSSPFTFAAGASTRKSYVGVNTGPVRIVSTQNIVAAERLIYQVNSVNSGQWRSSAPSQPIVPRNG